MTGFLRLDLAIGFLRFDSEIGFLRLDLCDWIPEVGLKGLDS